MNAIKLALSQQGGASGARSFPLLRDDTSWAALEGSALGLIEGDCRKNGFGLMEILLGIRVQPKPRGLQDLINAVCGKITECVNRQHLALSLLFLQRLESISLQSTGYVPFPILWPSWQATSEAFIQVCAEFVNRPEDVPTEDLADWVGLAALVNRVEPRVLKVARFPSKQEEAVKQLLSGMQSRESRRLPDDPDDLDYEISQIDAVEAAYDNLQKWYPKLQSEFVVTQDAMDRRRESVTELLDDIRSQQESDDDEDEHYERSSSKRHSEMFDVIRIFDDL